MRVKKNIAISETGFIFNPATGDSFTLNPIGLEILSFIEKNKKYEEIANTILEKYDVDSITFEKNYYDFIQMLKNNHLLEIE
ncbi:MAG: PqqD family protein [Bacteroidetes bacterium]|nr:MAG: PqqD family protein [Bacteroidota bacterium]